MIRYYGLYSSRTRGKTKQNNLSEKFGIKYESNIEVYEGETENASSKQSRRSWARLINKIYEVDPLICPKCNSEMKIIAVITESEEVNKIIDHLKKTQSLPPPYYKIPEFA